MATKKSTSATVKAGENAVQALSAFRYGQLRVGRGQVFDLAGAQHDERLVRMRYVVPVKEGTELIECGTCGATFLNEHWLKIHGDTWHTYECACGWVPQPNVAMSKDEQMRRHMIRCEYSASEREEAHKMHVQAAKESAAA